MALFNKFLVNILAVTLVCQFAWSSDLENEDVFFSSKQLSEFASQLTWLKIKLDKNNLGYEAVKNIQIELDNIKSQATSCVKVKKLKLQELSEILQLDAANSANKAEHLTIQKQYQDQLNACQQLLYQSQNLRIDSQSQLIYSKEYREFNNQRPTFLNIYYQFQNLSQSTIAYKNFTQVFADSIGILEKHQSNLTMLIIFGFLLGIFLQKLMIKRQIGMLFIKDMPYFFPLFIPVFLSYIFLKLITYDLLIEPKINNLIKILLIYLSVKGLSIFYLYYFSMIKKNPKWFKLVKSRLLIVVNSIIISSSLQFYLLNFLESNVRMNLLYFILSILFFVYFTTVCVYFVWGLTDHNYCKSIPKTQLNVYRYLGSACVILYFLSRTIFILLGYESFSSIQMALVICLVIYFFKMMGYLNKCENKLQENCVKYFKFLRVLSKDHKQDYLFELTLFRLTICAWLLILLIDISMNIFGVPDYYISSYHSIIFDKASIGSVSFKPINLINALGFFAICLFIGKILAAKTALLPSFSQDIDRQLTISIAVRYLVFSISLIIAFLIMGMGSLQLTLALGGIGLGLGMSLNVFLADFISGIILLIQKPIHHGDYITIMEKMSMSGYVQRIMLLSTQILVNDQSIVYVPNSLIIKNPLINHSAKEKLSTSFIEIKIKQIDDFVVVRSILQEIIKKNKFINQRQPHQPSITLVSSPHDYQDKDAYFIVHLYFSIMDQTQKQKIYVKLKKQIIWRLNHYLYE
jgi:small-conductance mechanosensitive channel